MQDFCKQIFSVVETEVEVCASFDYTEHWWYGELYTWNDIIIHLFALFDHS